MAPAGLGLRADSSPRTCVFSLLVVLGQPAAGGGGGGCWSFGMAVVLLLVCTSVGVLLEFGDFNLCSPLLFSDASSEERDKDGILLFGHDGFSLSPCDITAVARVLADLPVFAVTGPFPPGFPPPLAPLPFLLAPCSLKVSAAWRGFLGEARLRLKFGSAAQLLLGSVNSASSGIRCCGWSRSFPCFDTFEDVSMATGGKALIGQRERV